MDNSSVRPNIPLRYPEILPRYANEGRVTKSAQDPYCEQDGRDILSECARSRGDVCAQTL
jgi:hypothetical protein